MCGRRGRVMLGYETADTVSPNRRCHMTLDDFPAPEEGFAGASDSSSRRPRSGSTRTASRISPGSARTATGSTTTTSPATAPTRSSSTCSSTTPATWRSTRSSRSTSAPAGRPCSQCGVGTIRSSRRPGPRPSSPTSPTPTSVSSTPVISPWRPTSTRSQRPSTSSSADRYPTRRVRALAWAVLNQHPRRSVAHLATPLRQFGAPGR
jgi:hypothetical protein